MEDLHDAKAHLRLTRCKRVFNTLGFILTASSIVLFVFRGDVFPWLGGLDPSWGTASWLFALLVFTGQPFMPLYGQLVVTTAYILGWWALPLVYVASSTASVLTFWYVRGVRDRGLLSLDVLCTAFPVITEYFQAMERALGSHAVALSTLLQASYIPLGMTNAILGFSDVSWPQFTVSTLLSRVELVPLVSVGVHFHALVDWMAGATSFWQVFADPRAQAALAFNLSCSLAGFVGLGVWTLDDLRRHRRKSLTVYESTPLREHIAAF